MEDLIQETAPLNPAKSENEKPTTESSCCDRQATDEQTDPTETANENLAKEQPSVPSVCARCGAPLQSGQLFCGGCGQPVQSPASSMASPIPSPSANIPAENPAVKKKSRTPIILAIVGGFVVLLAIIICAGIFIANMSINSTRNFNTVFGEYASETWCEIAADGSYMTIDTNPYDVDDYMSWEAYDTIEDINEKLGFSGAVYKKMGETTALDGRQTESIDSVTVSWKYHPDNGLEVTYQWNK